MLPEDIKIALNCIYQSYIQQYMAIIAIVLILFLICIISTLFLGNNNVIEKDAEKIIEAEISAISSSVS